jgi:hypothetical protein
MTTNIQARDAIITEVIVQWAASAYAAVPLFWEAGPSPELDSLSEFVYGAVSTLHAEQASISETPLTRVHGVLRLTFLGKEPNGDRRPNQMAETLCDLLKHRNLSGVQTTTPTPDGREAHDGWYSTTWTVPFWHHK